VAFCVATCPKCSEQFRLAWRIGKRKLPPSSARRAPTDLSRSRSNWRPSARAREQFPKSVVVELSALVR